MSQGLRRIPEKVANYNVYIEGDRLLGLATVQLPSFEAITETIKGAGIMGEYNSPSIGQFTAMTMSMAFRLLYDNATQFVVGKPYTFDLRAAVETTDESSSEKVIVPERWSVRIMITKIDPGKREVAATADATIEGAVHIARQWIDGTQTLYFDIFNSIYEVNGEDVYASVRDAI